MSGQNMSVPSQRSVVGLFSWLNYCNHFYSLLFVFVRVKSWLITRLSSLTSTMLTLTLSNMWSQRRKTTYPQAKKLHKRKPSRNCVIPLVTLTNKQTIVKEKTEQELINSIGDFKKDGLKHTETVEKNPLPTKDDIEKEKSGA
ncbi:unnamed protein product [Acanthosepion pharaonis]|uniref:Uncharacterized protein n=1 Tax=Acanthosepion pharaonis TaxID=158019 RepID=A0A812BTM5_ACAPH|nr:unnamed protein product [Sepia pharaonis]